ncbi:MAG: hypothetical protein NVSMB10_14080 [Steroidobacteraceae bacterium]
MLILVVEDSPEVSLITVEYLAELGHDAVAVADAELAIQQLGERTFDAVMTDVSLPGRSGIDLAKEVMENYPSLPVVIASGYGAINVDALTGRQKGRVSVLQKPYDMAALDRTLRQAAAVAQA